MKKFLFIHTILAFCFSFVYNSSFAQVNMSTASGTYTQDFNTLASSGTGITWTDNSTIANWYSQRTGTGSLYGANDGSVTSTGNFLYSFGSTSSSDRALGTYGGATATFASAGDFAHGVLLRNTSGATMTDIRVSWTLEQWRKSGTNNTHTIFFWYKTSSSTITALNPAAETGNSTTNATNGWTAVTALNLNAPINTTAPAVLDGNASANRVSKTDISIPSLSLANNSYIMLKWDDPDHASGDQSMAIDDVTIAWGSAMPVELTSFEGKYTGGGANLLTWTTASERDNKGFDIERSIDGKNFEAIGQIKGNNKPSTYQFMDNQPFATSYYRLKQMDFDGKVSYSAIVSVVRQGKGTGLKVYPTLVTNNVLTVDTEGETRDFSVINLLGQQVLKGTTAAQIDVSVLSKGTYLIKVGTEVAKFVKQ
jgi:hypothetical protein